MGVSCDRHFLSSIFLNYFLLAPPRFAVLRPVFACPSGQLRLLAPKFPRTLVSFLLTHHTASVAVPCHFTGFPQGIYHEGFFLGSGSGMDGSQVFVESRCAPAPVSVSVCVSVSVAVSDSESESTSESSSESRSKSSAELGAVGVWGCFTGKIFGGDVVPAVLAGKILW